MADQLGALAVEDVAAAGAGVGLHLDGAGPLPGGDQHACLTLVAGLAPRRFLGVGLGGCRLAWSGWVEGGLGELEEFW